MSRSTVSKLKTFLLIDLIIVGIAAGIYFYLPTHSDLSVSAKSADFVFTNLMVNPRETLVGRPIQISVNVTNIGTIEGYTTVNLEINGAIADSAGITLAGLQTSEIVEFTVVKIDVGNYTVQIGDLVSYFLLKATIDDLDELPDDLVESSDDLTESSTNSSKIVLYGLKVNPDEIWPDKSATVSASAINPTDDTDSLQITLTVDNTIADTKLITVEAHGTMNVDFSVTVSAEGKHTVKLNGLSGSLTVVPVGYCTLIIDRSGGEGVPLPFTLNGETHETRFSVLLPTGQYKVVVPTVLDIGTGVVEFGSWSEGYSSREPSLTFTLDKPMTLVANYNLISGYASCPSLYIWNGDSYSYVTDVSNPGWLGYTGYINSNGEIIFIGGNPYDYVKLDKEVLNAKNGYFDIALFQQWDELYYLDYASLLVVDHPIDTEVYTSLTNYLNKGYTGQIYTTSTGALLVPVSAINEKDEDVLSAIFWQDGNFTPGVNGNDSPSWDNVIQNQLTLNLGDLSEADQIKLVITAMADWGPAETYYDWISKFQTAAAAGLITENTPIVPMPTLEVLAADGTWIETPQDRQIPLPSDYTARTFTVDLTGLFPKDTTKYVVRLTNFWNITYDYIGIDVTPQQDITLTMLKPSSAVLRQLWETYSVSSGAFTRYGDVTELLQDTDDLFVIGRQGDQVKLQFCIDDLLEPAEGMTRDYFFVVACWFKDPPDEWGYGFTFTVDPLPFLNMTGFPYTDSESYPYDAIHLEYLKEYNTRIIP
ncbi:MAG: hypothetical protein FWH37_00435 [Candidatus Bathyarchaeota archaeon]|nr:hypothetical protein [Candidatus Termiticorpusculum sp.]